MEILESTHTKESGTSGIDSQTWLTGVRQKAWDAFQKMEVPDRANQQWKYTDPKLFTSEVSTGSNSLSREYHVVETEILDRINPFGDLEASLLISESKDSPLLVQFPVNGILNGDNYVNDLHNANTLYPDLIRDTLGTLVGSEFGRLEACNLAIWEKGIFIHIPDNVTIPRPIWIRRELTGGTSLPRLLVIAGKQSRFTIIEELISSDGKSQSIVNSVSEWFLGDSASGEYAVLQNLGKNVRFHQTHRARLDRDSELKSVSLSLGAEVHKANLGTLLAGDGARSIWNGFVFIDGKQHFDHHTLHHHQAGNTYSNLNLKVAARDSSNSAYTGLIRIEEDAPFCQAYQENRNILLSDQAHAESIPELEIINEEVSCSHGVTVGTVDPEMMFYLESRGIAEEEAKQMIVHGFFEPSLQEISENFREVVRSMLLRKMDDMR